MKNNIKIYLICGHARNGKDTTAEFISEYFKDKRVINLSYGYYIKDYAKRISSWDGSDATKPRELLQQLGTEVIRKKIDSKLFIKRMIEDIKVFSFYYDIITISDGRLKAEIEDLRSIFDNIKVIHIDRPNFDNGLTEEQKHHITEIDLDDYNNYDYELINDGTLEDLKNKVFKIMEEDK